MSENSNRLLGFKIKTIQIMGGKVLQELESDLFTEKEITLKRLIKSVQHNARFSEGTVTNFETGAVHILPNGYVSVMEVVLVLAPAE